MTDPQVSIHIPVANLVVDGVVIGAIRDAKIPVSLVAEAMADGGTIGGFFSLEENNERDQQQLLKNTGGSAEGGTPPSIAKHEVTEKINRVWLHYAETMKPRRNEPTEEDRKLIRNALKVATDVELCQAITGCEKSDYHMKRGEYANRKGGKYNRLGQILKGRRGHNETTRDRIDFFLDRLEQATRGEKEVPSADSAIIDQKVAEVRQGHRTPEDEEAVNRAVQAETWLREHGIETARGEDGYPAFKRVGYVVEVPGE